MIPAALPAQWRARASEYEPYSPAAAQAFRVVADELDKALSSGEETVSLKEAANLGGYSVDHLQRMVTAGRIQNFGRKGKPRIRRVDVPLKPGHTATLRAESGRRYVEPSAIVASVIHRGGR